MCLAQWLSHGRHWRFEERTSGWLTWKDCQKHRLVIKPSVNTNQGAKRWCSPGPFLWEATCLGTSWANSWASEALESINEDWVLPLSVDCNPHPKGLFLEASLDEEYQGHRAEACLASDTLTVMPRTAWYSLGSLPPGRVTHRTKKQESRASLVAQWLRIRLPMQGTSSSPGLERSHMPRSN